MTSLLDRCIFNPSAGSTSDFTVSSAVTGYLTPAQAGAINGITYPYAAQITNLTQWEVGIGTYSTSGPILARTTILFSSNSNAKVNFTGIPIVMITVLAETFQTISARTQRQVTTTPIVIVSTDQIINCNISSGPATCTLPASSTRSGVPLTFKDIKGNFNSNSLTITPNGSDTIDGMSSLVLNGNYQGMTLVPLNDGVNSGWSIE